MRLTCPNCGAEYDVPDGMVPAAGRHVQCTACHTRWFARGARARPAPSEEQILDPPRDAAAAAAAPAGRGRLGGRDRRGEPAAADPVVSPRPAVPAAADRAGQAGGAARGRPAGAARGRAAAAAAVRPGSISAPSRPPPPLRRGAGRRAAASAPASSSPWCCSGWRSPPTAYRPEIVARVPAAAPALDAYGEAVDGLREDLEAGFDELRAYLDGVRRSGWTDHLRTAPSSPSRTGIRPRRGQRHDSGRPRSDCPGRRCPGRARRTAEPAHCSAVSCSLRPSEQVEQPAQVVELELRPALLAGAAADLVEERPRPRRAVALGQHVLVAADAAARAERPAERVAAVLGASPRLPTWPWSPPRPFSARRRSSPICRMPSRRLSIASAWRSSAPGVSPLAQPVARLAHVALGLAQRLARRLAGRAGQALAAAPPSAGAAPPAARRAAGRPWPPPSPGSPSAGRWPGCPAAAAGGTRAAAAGSCRPPAPAARAARRRGPASTAGPGRSRPGPPPCWPIIICMFSSICCSISSSASASALRPCSESSWIRSISSWIWSWVIVWPGGMLGLLLLAALDRLPRHLLHVVARRLAQLVHQLGDLLVGGVARAAPAAAAPWRAPAARRRRRGCRPRSAPPPATAPRPPRRAPPRRRPPPRPAPAGGSRCAPRDRRAGCRRRRPGWLVTARSTWVTRRAFAADQSRSRRCSISAARHRIVEPPHRQHRRRPARSSPVWPIASSAVSRTVTGSPANGCLEKSSTSVSASSSPAPDIGSGRSATSGGRGSGSAARP